MVVAAADGGQVLRRWVLEERQLVQTGAVGGVAVLVFDAETYGAGVADGVADAGAGGQALAVDQGFVAGLEIGAVRAVADAGRSALGAVVEDYVDNAGDGVRTVLGAGAVTQHLDAGDRADRDGVEVDRIGAFAGLGFQIDDGRGVAALAVHQHQHLVRAQAAQLGGAHVVGAGGVGLAREVQRRQQHLQGLAEFAVQYAGLGQVLAVEHVDRRRRFQRGAFLAAHAGDHDVVQGLGFGRGLRGGGGAERAEDGGGQQGIGGVVHRSHSQGQGESGGGRRKPAAGPLIETQFFRTVNIHPHEEIYFLGMASYPNGYMAIRRACATLCHCPSPAEP